ncbi:MAG TPA: hypothetical protein DDW52_05975, partial [Planctomycetaceae bacterium]|nr:hypothetical protein [Planctomycetaceae bacterium]
MISANLECLQNGNPAVAETSDLRFGTQTRWRLDHRSISDVGGRLAAAQCDLASAVETALTSPTDFPSWDTAIVAGDKVVLIADPAAPQIDEVVGRVAEWFLAQSVSAENLAVVVGHSGDEAAEAIRARLTSSGVNINVQLHDPDDTDQISYLAADTSADAIYLNRLVVDADVVLPIGCARSNSALDGLGCFGTFPILSDRDTRAKFYRLDQLRTDGGRAALRDAASQAAWWLGVMAAMQVLPGGEGQVAGITSGILETSSAAVQTQFDQDWKTSDELSDLVIALVDGDAAEQSWLSVARAVFRATRNAKPGGSIVVCTELADLPGKALRRLGSHTKSQSDIENQIRKSREDDAIAAAVLLDATEDYHVYLASRLRRDTVERLRMGVIESEEQLQRLAGSLASCAIIRS